MKQKIAALALLLLSSQLYAQSVFHTPITTDNIDPAAYAQWVKGKESAIVSTDSKNKDKSAEWVLWTQSNIPGHNGINFGAGKSPGARHLRIGFKQSVQVGTAVTFGIGRLSVLKPDAAYPGDMADESQWIPAQRLLDSKVVGDEAKRNDEVLWTLPSTTNTRAIRFTHEASLTDRDYSGFLAGVYVLAQRLVNLAPQAMVSASSNQEDAKRLTNENSDEWKYWSNISLKDGDRNAPVSSTSPESITLLWNVPVNLCGVATIFAGFKDAEVQIFIGPDTVHPREAKQSDWKTIKSFSGLTNRFPTLLGLDWLDFGQTVNTRAVRLLMTAPQAEGKNPNVKGYNKDGKRIWIAELLALSPLGNSGIAGALLPAAIAPAKPPVPIKFDLPECGNVTLVIEDQTGRRVRNLVSDTYFEKGKNTVWWDASDDLGRDPSAALHGLYLIPTQFVKPGNYRVRGLWHRPVNVKYEFGYYTAGNPPWQTGDRSGGWLANHTPPQAIAYVPDAGNGKPSILVGSYVSEGTSGLAWLDTNGNKWKGQDWVGGLWTGAPFITRDQGPEALPEVYAYVGSTWISSNDTKLKMTMGEIRLTGLTSKGELPIATHSVAQPKLNEDERWSLQISGLAAHNGLLVVSIPLHDQLLFVDAKARKVLGEASLQSPRGLAFNARGNLLALSGTSLLQYELAKDPSELPVTITLVSQELEDPQGIATDPLGKIYVSDRGQSHQVKVFDSNGKFLRSIGHAGAPKAGPYDPLHMNNPRGIAIDPQGKIWVAEEDFQPKRVSVWKPDGTFIKAFYGPAEYGGGGSIDPYDKTRMYYNGMEFKLDWDKGTSTLNAVIYRAGGGVLEAAFRSGMPQNAMFIDGRRYWSNAFNSNPISGHGTAFIFADRNGIAVPVAAAGRASEWNVLKEQRLAGAWPIGVSPKEPRNSKKTAFFLWSDLNSDSQVQTNELKMTAGYSGGVTVMRDGSFVIARLAANSAPGKALRFAPKFAKDVPVYNIKSPQIIADGAQLPPTGGGDQVLLGKDGWSIFTTAVSPFSTSGFTGVKNGTPMWSYPSLWPGLPPSHEAPVPEHRGEIIGHTRLLGDMIEPQTGEPLWLLNNNTGPISIFTQDGLFVSQIFQDMRVGRSWSMPTAQRGMNLNEMTPGDENFFPNVTQTVDRMVYLTAGRPNCIVRVEGLDTIHRIAPFSVSVSNDDLNRARDYFTRLEESRQNAQGHDVMTVALQSSTPSLDGRIDEWEKADWVDIDKRGVAAYFNSPSKPYDVTGAVTISDGKLFAAWHTGDKNLLENSGETPAALFKTGGALDLMIGCDPKADPKRVKPVLGDLRFLVTRVGNKTKALIYRSVASKKKPIPFSSPGRTIVFDRVEDVSDQVELVSKGGDYELSVPLETLGLSPEVGTTVQADIGILRGNGTATTQRVYWTNKSTAIVSDVPSEAELKPNLWGRWKFKKE